MQITRGLVNITNGSNIVIGDASALFSAGSPAVVAGNVFKIDTELVWYVVASVDSDTQITLAETFAGDTGTGLSYTIAQDFTPNLNMIQVNKGDAELAEILKRNYDILDQAYGKINNVIQMTVFFFTAEITTGDGKYYVHIPNTLNGMNLTTVHAQVITAGVTGATNVQIHNVTDGVDMLSTKLTIESTHTGSDTSATPAVIDTDNDDVALNDLLRIDVDAVSSTAPKGLIVTMEFNLP